MVSKSPDLSHHEDGENSLSLLTAYDLIQAYSLSPSLLISDRQKRVMSDNPGDPGGIEGLLGGLTGTTTTPAQTAQQDDLLAKSK